MHAVLYDKLTEDKLFGLKSIVTKFKCWEALGFSERVKKEETIERLRELGKKVKITLVRVIRRQQFDISNSDLMALYNGVIYPKVKKINDDRVKKNLE